MIWTLGLIKLFSYYKITLYLSLISHPSVRNMNVNHSFVFYALPDRYKSCLGATGYCCCNIAIYVAYIHFMTHNDRNRRKSPILRFPHDDVIKWKHFPRNWPFVRGIHRSPVNSPHKGQWRGALMISLICVWLNDWVNNREAGDLRRCNDIKPLHGI